MCIISPCQVNFLYDIGSSNLTVALHYLFSASHQAEVGKVDVCSLKQFVLAVLLSTVQNYL